MSKESPSTEATEAEATEEPTTATTGAPPEEEGTEEQGTGNEAAKYRRRLRDTEGERDTLRGQVEALQRSQVERIASAKLSVPAGMWASGLDLATLIGEDGNVDPVLVLAAVETARAELGLEPNRCNGNYVPNEGRIPEPPRSTGFADSLN